MYFHRNGCSIGDCCDFVSCFLLPSVGPIFTWKLALTPTRSWGWCSPIFSSRPNITVFVFLHYFGMPSTTRKGGCGNQAWAPKLSSLDSSWYQDGSKEPHAWFPQPPFSTSALMYSGRPPTQASYYVRPEHVARTI